MMPVLLLPPSGGLSPAVLSLAMVGAWIGAIDAGGEAPGVLGATAEGRIDMTSDGTEDLSANKTLFGADVGTLVVIEFGSDVGNDVGTSAGALAGGTICRLRRRFLE
jgi:hypothetical protein